MAMLWNARFDWTVENIERLKALWANGDTCTEIAVAMGGGLTRNAVIGKVTRLNLAKRRNAVGYYVAKPKQQRAPCAIRKNGAGFVPLAAEDQKPADDVSSVHELEAQTPPATFLGIALIDLKPEHCRYPRTIDGTTLFCGQPKLEDSSYCAACHKRCHSRATYHLNMTDEHREQARQLAFRNKRTLNAKNAGVA